MEKLDQIRKDDSIRDTIDFPFPLHFRTKMKPAYKTYFPNREYRNYTQLFPEISDQGEDELATEVVHAIDQYLADLSDKNGEKLLYGTIHERVDVTEFNNEARDVLLTGKYSQYYEASEQFCKTLAEVLEKCKNEMKKEDLSLLHKTSQVSDDKQAEKKRIGNLAYVMFVVLLLLKLYRGLFKAKKDLSYEVNFKPTDKGIICATLAKHSGLSEMLKVMLFEYTKYDEKTDRYGTDEAITEMENFTGKDDDTFEDAESGDEYEEVVAGVEALAAEHAKEKLRAEEAKAKEEAENADRQKRKAEDERMRLEAISKEKTAAADVARRNLEEAKKKLTEKPNESTGIAEFEKAERAAAQEEKDAKREAEAKAELEKQLKEELNKKQEVKQAEIEELKKEAEEKTAAAERNHARPSGKRRWSSFDVPVVFDATEHTSYIVLTLPNAQLRIPHGFVPIGPPLVEDGKHIQAFTRRMVDLLPFMLAATHLLPKHAGKDEVDRVGPLTADASNADVPIADTSNTDVPIADASNTDVPIADVPIANVPIADASNADVPIANVPIANVTIANVPIADVPSKKP